MCVRGYGARVNDRIVLNRLIDKELHESGLLRRLSIKIARRRAARSLSEDSEDTEASDRKQQALLVGDDARMILNSSYFHAFL
jgi:hypothetical protein